MSLWTRLLTRLDGLSVNNGFGPRDLSLYPPRETSPYRLPWLAGIEYWCVQGNNGKASHFDWLEYGYDFFMLTGSVLTAARGGVVTEVKQSSNYIGNPHFNNYVVIEHDDDTTAYYLHIRKRGARVRVGQQVEQGEPIALSGWTGYAALPHLHFHVEDENGDSVPLTFQDVVEDEGIPRSFRYYRAAGAGPAR